LAVGTDDRQVECADNVVGAKTGLEGVERRFQQMQQGMDREDANRLQVMAELQADCFAGVWANHSQQKWKFLDPGDVETALQTASAIGDDRLQRRHRAMWCPTLSRTGRPSTSPGSSQGRLRAATPSMPRNFETLATG